MAAVEPGAPELPEQLTMIIGLSFPWAAGTFGGAAALLSLAVPGRSILGWLVLASVALAIMLLLFWDVYRERQFYRRQRAKIAQFRERRKRHPGHPPPAQ